MKPLMNMELTKGAVDFINDELLHNLINNTKEDPEKNKAIFEKCRAKQALNLEEVASLIAINSKEGLEELFSIARELKKSIYGNRIVLFAPLYIGNYCINDCKYCGFRKSLRTTVRQIGRAHV